MVFFDKKNKRLIWNGLFSLMRVNQSIGFFLFLWPTLWALWLFEKKIPDFHVLIMFIISVLLMRSFGCVINDCIDRNIDCYIQRTSNRPLSCGLVSMVQALVLFIILLFFLCIVLIALAVNIQTFALSFLLLVLTCIYPYTKRCISFPQIFLGITFGFSIFIISSVLGVSLCNILPWLLFLVNVVWTVIYDTEYAMVDRDDDIFFGVKSSAVYLGNYERVFIGVLQVIMLFLLIVVGLSVQLSIIFYSSLIGVAILFVWQQVLIFNRNSDKCFQAFLSNNYVGILLFLGIVLDIFDIVIL